MHTVRPIGISFLDPDHVVRLGRSLLAWDGDEDRTYVRDFFLPEVVDEAEIAGAGAPLREAHRLRVASFGDEAALRDAEVLVFRRGRIDAGVLARAPRLKFIQRIGASSHPIDLQATRERGIAVSCLPRLTLVHVAEHAMLLMLALSRRVLDCDRAVRAGGPIAGVPGKESYNWANIGGLSLLAGRTLGIVGFGEIGQLLARRASGFGMRIICADRKVLDSTQLADVGIQQVEFTDLLRTADFVSVHVPPLPDGRPLIGASELASMKPTAFLINTARGLMVDEDHLSDALAEGRIAGAGLDVHTREPRGPGDRLASLANVVLTPHMAGGSRRGVLDEMTAIFANIGDALAGHAPRHARVA
jgi:phosphoglycerate dehydrogenase-like enzyme